MGEKGEGTKEQKTLIDTHTQNKVNSSKHYVKHTISNSLVVGLANCYLNRIYRNSYRHQNLIIAMLD